MLRSVGGAAAMRRRLEAEEAALGARVTATIRPLERKRTGPPRKGEPPAVPSARPLRAQPAPVRSAAPPLSAHTLDGSWDRRIAGGQVVPDLTVDLHGHNLNSAHALLERRLGEAIAHGQRVLLVLTGRPPRPDQNRSEEHTSELQS